MRGRTLSPLAVTNLVGVAGLVATVVAIGALVGWRWALLAAGLAMVGVSYTSSRSIGTPAVGAATSRPVAPAPSQSPAAARRGLVRAA